MNFLISKLLWIPLTLAVGVVIGFFLGVAKGEINARHQNFEYEKNLIEPILSTDKAFTSILIHERSIGGVFLDNVHKLNKEERARLKSLINHELGIHRANELVYN